MRGSRSHGIDSCNRLVRGALIGTATVLVAACAAQQSAPIVASAPQVVIPPRPRPPLNAQLNMIVPPVDTLGGRRTVNVGITPAQTLWNLRSAYNVAALNCMQAEHAAILSNYKQFLLANTKALTAANKQVDVEFRAKKGAGAVRAREAYMTQVYNFYALPPTLPAFCDAALAMSQSVAAMSPPLAAAPTRSRKGKVAAVTYKPVPPAELDAFAAAELPKLDRVFLDFYNSYDQYRADLANWQQKYAPTEVAPAPVTAISSN